MNPTVPPSWTAIPVAARRAIGAIAGAAAVAAVMASPAASSPEHPCKLPGFSSVKFIEGVSGSAGQIQLVVRNARVICGGPDDEHWDPVGTAHHVPLPTSAKIRLIPDNSTTMPRPATLSQLRRLTELKTRDKQFGWFGGGYGVRTSPSGQITSVTELFHP